MYVENIHVQNGYTKDTMKVIKTKHGGGIYKVQAFVHYVA